MDHRNQETLWLFKKYVENVIDWKCCIRRVTFKLVYLQAYVVTTNDYVPMRMTSLDHNSFMCESESLGDVASKISLVSKPTQCINDKDDCQNISAEKELFLFSESDEDLNDEHAQCQEVHHGYSENTSANAADKDDLLDGLDDPF